MTKCTMSLIETAFPVAVAVVIRRRRFVGSVLALALFAALGATDATANIAFIAPPASLMPSGSDYQAGIPVVLGNVFTANTNNISVYALGFYQQPNLTGSEVVGLYNQSGTLLASVTVLLSDSVVSGFYFHNLITPVALTAGTQYTVAAQVGNNPWSYGPAPTTPADVTFNYDDYLYTSGLVFPTTAGGSGPGYYGTNFEFTTPEPGFYGALALGLCGLVVGLTRRRRRA
jgi:hypothetical protein